LKSVFDHIWYSLPSLSGNKNFFWFKINKRLNYICHIQESKSFKTSFHYWCCKKKLHLKKIYFLFHKHRKQLRNKTKSLETSWISQLIIY
jgi:hypothetical protein